MVPVSGGFVGVTFFLVGSGLDGMSKATDELKKEVAKLEDIVDELRLCVKYLELDLEATKREMKGK